MKTENEIYRGYRQNITPGSRELARYGPSVSDAYDPLDEDYPMYSPEVDQVWLAHRKEFYEINAVLVSYLVSGALKHHEQDPNYEFRVMGPDVGWVNRSGGGSFVYSDMKAALDLVGTFIHKVVGEHIEAEISILDNTLTVNDSDHPLARLYKRYRKLFDFSSKYEVYDDQARDKSSYRGGDTPQRSLNRGLGSAALVMSSTLQHIPILFKQDFPDIKISAQNLVHYAVYSFPSIGEQAMANLRHFVNFPHQDIDNFKLVKNRNGLRLGIKEGKFKKTFDQKTYYKLLKNRPFDLLELGCPAMVDFGDAMDSLLQSGDLEKTEEGSVAFVLWLWAIGLAEPIYAHYFGE